MNSGEAMTDGAILEDGADARDPETEKESHEMHNLAGRNLSPNRIEQEMNREMKTKTKQKAILNLQHHKDFSMRSVRNGQSTLQKSESSAEEVSEGDSDNNSSAMSDEFPTLPIDEVKELEGMKKRRKRKRRGGVRSSTLPCFARMTAEDSLKAE